jgi:hypothetical protein
LVEILEHQMKSEPYTHYRLADRLYEEGVTVCLEKFKVVKETPCGHWVVSQYAPEWLTPQELIKRKYAKWVSKTSLKRYCYPTMEMAVESFKRRKQVQLNKLEDQVAQAKFVVSHLGELPVNEEPYREGVNLGMPEEFEGLCFDY